MAEPYGSGAAFRQRILALASRTGTDMTIAISCRACAGGNGECEPCATGLEEWHHRLADAAGLLPTSRKAQTPAEMTARENVARAQESRRAFLV